MPTLVACLWRRVEAIQLGRVPTHFGPATRLRRPESQWNQGALATLQVEMCPRTANSGLAVWTAERTPRHVAHAPAAPRPAPAPRPALRPYPTADELADRLDVL